MEINDDHEERAQFLRPLSMTCRAMRLRLLPWIWDLLEPSSCRYGNENFEPNLVAIANASRADTFLAASVKYSCALLYPCAGADSYPLKVHDSALPVG